TELAIAMTLYHIDDPDAVAVFLAQIAVESMEMNRLDENLNYSAERLMAVWPKRFPTLALAEPFARNPQALANSVYASRMGNGPPQSGDGWKYRGRGLKMVTGKDNYRATGDALGMPLLDEPDLLCEKRAAAQSAAYFWFSRPHNLNAIADDLPDDDDDADFATVTKIINGGHTGLAQRRVYWTRARKALGLTIEPTRGTA
ncbi:MAG: glycoside hydrolase family 19 protein, partial [Lautropia sp.]